MRGQVAERQLLFNTTGVERIDVDQAGGNLRQLGLAAIAIRGQVLNRASR